MKSAKDILKAMHEKLIADYPRENWESWEAIESAPYLSYYLQAMEEYAQQSQPSGMRWVRASERLPVLPHPLPKDNIDERGILFVNRYHSAGAFWYPSYGVSALSFLENYNGWDVTEWEWLDESSPAGAAEEELKVTEALLNERQRVLDAIPECPEHGRNCVPHAIEWIEKAKLSLANNPASEGMAEALRVLIDKHSEYDDHGRWVLTLSGFESVLDEAASLPPPPHRMRVMPNYR